MSLALLLIAIALFAAATGHPDVALIALVIATAFFILR